LSVSRGGKTHDREIRIAIVAAFCHSGATVVTGMVNIDDVIAGVIARFARKMHGLRESCKSSKNILLRHSQKCPSTVKKFTAVQTLDSTNATERGAYNLYKK
jgi:hypothetical protein